MKSTILLSTLLLASTGVAQDSVPPLPADSPQPPVPRFPEPPLPAPVAPANARPDAPGALGSVPRVSLQPQDKIGRTYAEGSPFNIWGGTRNQRSNLFSAAGLVRRALIDALHLPDQWTYDIVIQLREPLSAGTDSRLPVWTTIAQVEGGFRIEINVVPRRQAVPGPLLRENLVRAILADAVLKGKKSFNLEGAPLPPPDWLLHGTIALMDYRELGRMSDTFSRVFRLGRVLSVQDILNGDPAGMDSVSLTLYRVSCGGLLMMLLEQPSGPEHLAKLLPSLAVGGTDHAQLIEQTFPALSGSSNSLSKWWSLQIAALSQPGLDEVQKPAETEKLLAEALILHFTPPAPVEKRANPLKKLFTRGKDKVEGEKAAAPAAAPLPAPAAESCDITEFARVLSLPDSGSVFNQADLALTRLMLRAHPVYRPIIQEYQDSLRLLAKGKSSKTLSATFARLATTRQKLAENLRAIENHLDWYEATQTTVPSGAFEDYLRTADELEKPLPPRNDAISRYLDEVGAEENR